VTANIAGACKPTAASIGNQESAPPTECVDALLVHSGINAGASIVATPCAPDIMREPSASPICRAGVGSGLSWRCRQ